MSTFLEPRAHVEYSSRAVARSPARSRIRISPHAARRAGNVITLADAVDAGLDNGQLTQSRGRRRPTASGRRSRSARSSRRRILPCSRRLRPAWRTTSSRWTATAWRGGFRRSCDKGERFMPLAGRGGRARRRRLSARRSRSLDGDGDPHSRSRDPARAGESLLGPRSGTDPRSADDADQLPRAGAGGRQASVSVVRGVAAVEVAEPDCEVGEKPEVIAADVFKDKIVFVGIAFSGLVDVFQTPLGAGS